MRDPVQSLETASSQMGSAPASGVGPSLSAGIPTLEERYQERLHRYVTAMRNGQPDRVPIRLFAEEFAAKFAGYSNFEPALDYDLAFTVTRRARRSCRTF